MLQDSPLIYCRSHFVSSNLNSPSTALQNNKVNTKIRKGVKNQNKYFCNLAKKNLNNIHGIKNQNKFPDQNAPMLTILCALVTSHSLALRNRTKTSSGYPWCIFWKLSKSGYKTKFHLYTSQVENSLRLHTNARTTTRRTYENILRKK